MIPYIVQDPRDYFYSQQANALKTLGDAAFGAGYVKCHVSKQEAYTCLRESISDIKSVGLQTSIIKAEVAFKVCIYCQFFSLSSASEATVSVSVHVRTSNLLHSCTGSEQFDS